MPIQIGAKPDHGFDEPLGLLTDCHRRIENFLQTLCVIADTANGASLSPRQRADAEAAIRYFATAAPKHTADEEESLFPRMRASSDPAAARALDIVADLERDHDAAETRHAAVEVIMRRWLADDQIESASVDALRDHLRALQDLYQRHIAVEDRDVFPTAARLLSTTDIQAIGREMAARRR